MAQANTLLEEQCAACKPGTPALPAEEARALLAQIPGWTIQGGTTLRREYLMQDFSAAVRLIERIADEANAQDHHPDVHLTGYRHLAIELSTHSIGGLSRNDFILAAKIDALPKELKQPG